MNALEEEISQLKGTDLFKLAKRETNPRIWLCKGALENVQKPLFYEFFVNQNPSLELVFANASRGFVKTLLERQIVYSSCF